MIVALAQTQPVVGDFSANLARHLDLAHEAAVAGAEAVFFPELSLTGYEPKLADSLAVSVDDSRFEGLQNLAREKQLLIGAGMPIQTADGPAVGMLHFHADGSRTCYLKQCLHADEEPDFVAGPAGAFVLPTTPSIGLAICYELSLPAHTNLTMDGGAAVFLASSAKTREGMKASQVRLAAIAQKYQVPVLIVNSVGLQDGVVCAGQSTVWDSSGNRKAALEADQSGLMVVDLAELAVH